MTVARLHRTVGVRVGRIQVGGGAPVVVQSMTSTDTTDVDATVAQCLALAEAGSEMVRVTVNVPEAAQAVPDIKRRLVDAGCEVPLIGDFHYNGHLLLTRYPDCAEALPPAAHMPSPPTPASTSTGSDSPGAKTPPATARDCRTVCVAWVSRPRQFRTPTPSP